MNIKLRNVLKNIGVAGILLCFYPAIALINGFAKNESFSMNLIELLIIIAIGFVGVFFGFITNKMQLYHPVSHKLIVFLISAALTFAGTMLMSKAFDVNFAQSLILSILIGIAFIAGVALFYTDLENITLPSVLIILTLLFLVSNLILWLVKLPYSENQFATLLMIVFCINALMQNQMNIDKIMERRHHSKSSLPKKIRYFNIKLLSVLFAIFLIFFFLRNQFVWLLKKIIDSFIFIVAAIARFLNYLISLLPGTDDVTTYYHNLEELNETYEDGKSDPLNIVLAIFFIALVILVIRYRKQIILGIIRYFTNIFSKIAELFKRNTRTKKDDLSEAYTDTDEFISEEETNEEEDETTKTWKKRYHDYLKMPKSEEKYRMGYGLAVSGLMRKFRDINPSCTPNEICKSVGLLPMRTDLKIPTSVYSLIRYGEENYNGSFKELDQVLEVIKKTWKMQLFRSVSRLSEERETIDNK